MSSLRAATAPLLVALLLAAASTVASASPIREPSTQAKVVRSEKGAAEIDAHGAIVWAARAAPEEEVAAVMDAQGAMVRAEEEGQPRPARRAGRKKARAEQAALEVDAGESTPAARDLTERTSIFAQLDDSYFQPLDTDKTPEENARLNFDTAFDKRMKTFQGTLPDEDVMTREEVEDFKKRFIDEVGLKFWAGVKREADPAKKHKLWVDALSQAMEDQTPAVTEKMLAKIESEQTPMAAMETNIESDGSAGWTAVKKAESPWLRNLSKADVKVLSGTIREEAAGLLEESEKISYTGPPTLDLRDGSKWPKCKEVFKFVRDQGGCGSCWAMTVAGVADGQACILSGGKFSGPAGQLSGGYLASCNTQEKGCQGGSLRRAMLWAGRHGIPTGGSGSNAATCVPYFGSGDSLKHFTNTQNPPKCPSSCVARNNYGRPLKEDMFKISTLQHAKVTRDFGTAKSWISERGPIGIGFDVYSDFMTYKSGVYTHVTGAKSGGHGVKCVGYGSNFILCVNSWGARWGDKGAFKISASFSGIHGFYGPGAVWTSKTAGFPNPVLTGQQDRPPGPSPPVPQLQNMDKDCWAGCLQKPGKCGWCGSAGACCKKGDINGGAAECAAVAASVVETAASQTQAAPLTDEEQLQRLVQSLASIQKLRSSFVAAAELQKDGSVWPTIQSTLEATTKVMAQLKGKSKAEQEKLMQKLERSMHASAENLQAVTHPTTTPEKHSAERTPLAQQSSSEAATQFPMTHSDTKIIMDEEAKAATIFIQMAEGRAESAWCCCGFCGEIHKCVKAAPPGFKPPPPPPPPPTRRRFWR